MTVEVWQVERYDPMWGGWKPAPRSVDDDSPARFLTDREAWSEMTYMREHVNPRRQYRIREIEPPPEHDGMDLVKARCRQEWSRPQGGYARCGKPLDGLLPSSVPGFGPLYLSADAEHPGTAAVKCGCGFYNYVTWWVDGRVVVKASGER